MDQSDILKLQKERGTKAVSNGDSASSSEKTLSDVVNDCRRYIADKTDVYRELDAVSKQEKIKEIIIDYVMNTNPMVVGYVDSNNNTDTTKLVDTLVKEITDWGVLTDAKDDETIYEIRCNGKNIYVEQGGRCITLKDKEGRKVQFESVEQQDILLKRMLGDVKLSAKDALVNSTTIEGYRIAAVHSSALGNDPLRLQDNKYNAFVLRKFHSSPMELEDIVRSGTMSDDMARLLALAVAGGLTFFVVGPTASGKTTTLNSILRTGPTNIRKIVLQNPSEMDLRIRNSMGEVINDCLHMEAHDIENPTTKDPTPTNCMDHILRLSPTIVTFGEMRANKEFKFGVSFMEAGHPYSCSYHAEDCKGAIKRYETAYLSESPNEPSKLALSTITGYVNLVVVQMLMPDGTRRVLEIGEVVGVDPNNEEEPQINLLYEYIADEDKIKYDEYGNVVDMPGKHVRVGKLSEKTMNKFRKKGVIKKRYDFLLKEVSKSEVQTYTGNNITMYGIDKSQISTSKE